MNLGDIGKALLLAASMLAVIGASLLLLDRFPALHIGRLPGDLYFRKGNWRVYFPLGTSLLLSLLLTLILWVWARR